MGDEILGKDEYILPLNKQYEVRDSWLKYRLENILPEIMLREEIDMWIILAREYNEDPIFSTMIPSLMRTASRLSCLVFYLNGDRVEPISLSRPNPLLERYYKRGYDSSLESQWEALRRLVNDKNPKKIGINVSKSWPLADGLTTGLYNKLIDVLGVEYEKYLVSGEKLAIGWLEKRSESELKIYSEIYEIAIDIIEEAFSNKVIEVGKTTTTDLEWWIMEKINSLGLKAWFTPTIDLQRRGIDENRVFNTKIMPGDILHCDVGIEYMGLCTDTQRIAYVLNRDEVEVPKGLRNALKICNDFQNIVKYNFIFGRSGNDILINSLNDARDKGIKAMLYTHPIGYHGHGVGPTIGLWDNQDEVPIRGDYQLYYDTCYALELNTASRVPEWNNQEVYIFLEETVSFGQNGLIYLKDRQENFILIKS